MSTTTTGRPGGNPTDPINTPKRVKHDLTTETGGLKAAALADAVRRAPWTILTGTRSECAPVIVKPFERSLDLYHYEDGVWRPGGERIVHRRCAQLLGDRYRPSHAATAIDIIRHGEDVLDDDPLANLINCGNGLLDWRSGRLLDHSPATPTRIQIPTRWDPNADCPQFEAWLDTVVDSECVDLVFEMIGYCLLNANPLHKAFLIFGTGRNGKGTLLRTITKLLGQDNVSAVPPQALDSDRFAAADLFDKLANLAGDVSPRSFATTETFKKATGGDLLRAERKFGQPFQFEARATTIAAFNELPTTSDTSEGFFTRWVVLPMTRGYFPAGTADPGIERGIQTPGELAGILTRSVDALRRLMCTSQFSRPPAVAEAMAEFETFAHPVRAFITDFADGALGATDTKYVDRSLVYDAYRKWSDEGGQTALSARRFYADIDTLKALPGFTVSGHKSNGIRSLKFERSGQEEPQTCPEPAPSPSGETQIQGR